MPSENGGLDGSGVASKLNPRIVHYYPRALVGDGGCTNAVRGWASALAGAGAHVLVAYDQEGERPNASNVHWLRVPHRGRAGMRAPIGLERVLDNADVLVLHSGWVYHNVQAATSAVRSGVPYLLTPHGAYDPNIMQRRKALKRVWWKLFEWGLFTHARAAHVNFEEERQYLERLGYAGPIIVAPNGMVIPPLGKRRFAQSDYVLWMGRFDIEHKGIDLLLHALASLPPDVRPPARLHGPDFRGGKRRAIQLVHELGLESSVTIGPPVYGLEKWEVLRDSRLFVFPSRWESLGFVALEAAGTGVPLVVTATTFLGRYLAAEGAAILAQPDARSIAAGILKGWSSEAAQLGTRASEVVREKFSWSTVAERYLGQLERLL